MKMDPNILFVVKFYRKQEMKIKYIMFSAKPNNL